MQYKFGNKFLSIEKHQLYILCYIKKVKKNFVQNYIHETKS